MYEECLQLFVLKNLYQWIHHICDDSRNLIHLLLWSYCFLMFQKKFHALLVCFQDVDRKTFIANSHVKILDFYERHLILQKKIYYGIISRTFNDWTNSLLILVNAGLIIRSKLLFQSLMLLFVDKAITWT